ncbi:MAG: hypothetical protein IKO72_09785 [Kiritimatiellae bacterium]|nr:hypothetical protein [Kiritimatiellia bacterium]
MKLGMPSRGQITIPQQQVVETYSKFDLRTKRGRQAFINANYERAVEVVCAANRASVATLQRNMGIRYIDAVRLIDELENRGVIGPERPGWPTRGILVVRRNGRVTRPV